MCIKSDFENQRKKRERCVSVDEFKSLLTSRKIRLATLNDMMGTHSQKPLYLHPNTGVWFIAV